MRLPACLVFAKDKHMSFNDAEVPSGKLIALIMVSPMADTASRFGFMVPAGRLASTPGGGVPAGKLSPGPGGSTPLRAVLALVLALG